MREEYIYYEMMNIAKQKKVRNNDCCFKRNNGLIDNCILVLSKLSILLCQSSGDVSKETSPPGLGAGGEVLCW